MLQKQGLDSFTWEWELVRVCLLFKRNTETVLPLYLFIFQAGRTLLRPKATLPAGKAGAPRTTSRQPAAPEPDPHRAPHGIHTRPASPPTPLSAEPPHRAHLSPRRHLRRGTPGSPQASPPATPAPPALHTPASPPATPTPQRFPQPAAPNRRAGRRLDRRPPHRPRGWSGWRRWPWRGIPAPRWLAAPTPGRRTNSGNLCRWQEAAAPARPPARPLGAGGEVTWGAARRGRAGKLPCRLPSGEPPPILPGLSSSRG